MNFFLYTHAETIQNGKKLIGVEHKKIINEEFCYLCRMFIEYNFMKYINLERRINKNKSKKKYFNVFEGYKYRNLRKSFFYQKRVG